MGGLAGAPEGAAVIVRPLIEIEQLSPTIADANMASVVVVSLVAIAGAVLLTRVRLRRPAAPPTPVGGGVHAPPHAELVHELLHCAELVEREGLASLSHPLNRSTDPDIQYAIDLVCTRADPRIVRGVLVDRLLENSFEPHTQAPSLLSRRSSQSLATAMLILAPALWMGATLLGIAMAPPVAGLLLVVWCASVVVWLVVHSRPDSGASGDVLSERMVKRHILILTAAEGLARGEQAAIIEQKLMVETSSANTIHELSSAA